MEFVAFFFIGFFVIVFVFGPLFGAESRPDFLRPDLRSRQPKLVDSVALMELRRRRSSGGF